MIAWLILISTLHNYLIADQIDNGLTGSPVVQCGSESLSIFFNTRNSFEGHVYVRGHYSLKSCRTDATLESKANLTVSYASCDIIKQRSSNPRGIIMTATVIISFHPMFITKSDNSFKVQCFYAEISKTVTKQLSVDISKTQEQSIFVMAGEDQAKQANSGKLNDSPSGKQLSYNAPLPDCRYKVLDEGKTNEVSFATVGQVVYHEWSCTSSSSDKKSGNESSPYCVTVHSCNAKDETGKEAQIFDENGCAVDKYLMNNLEYTNDLTGGQFSQVFKFADQPAVFFQCKIRLSLKNEHGACTRSSDECPATLRGKRSVENDQNEFDVISQKMTVLDIGHTISNSDGNGGVSYSPTFSDVDVCVSTTTASGFALFTFSLLLASLLSILLSCCRSKTIKVELAP